MLSGQLKEFLTSSNQIDSIAYLEYIVSLPGSDKIIPNIDEDFLEKSYKFLGLEATLKDYLKSGLQLLQDIPELKELLVLGRRAIENYINIDKSKWPVVPEEKHVYAKAFEMYVFIFNVPLMLERYESLKIPLQYAIDLLVDFKIWVEDYFGKHQKYGLAELGWLCNHLNLKTFQIGRLQYEPRQNPLPYFGFRNHQTNQLLVMVNKGLEVRKDGLFNGCNGLIEKDVYRTDFYEDEKSISGLVVNPHGFITDKIRSLEKKDWVQILCPNSTVLALHIPASGALKKELLDQSLLAAIDFFQTYFPAISFNCFMTTTWFMDPTIAKYLPQSNIAIFQKSGYLLPIPKANDHQFFERVFGSVNIDIENFLPTTSLQKMGIEHIRQGGHWKMYGFLLLKSDIPLTENLYRL